LLTLDKNLRIFVDLGLLGLLLTPE